MRITYAIVGTVIEWRDQQGYGFVNVDVADGPVFVHRTQVQNGQPRVGDRLRLAGAHCGTRGWRADGVAELLEGGPLC